MALFRTVREASDTRLLGYVALAGCLIAGHIAPAVVLAVEKPVFVSSTANTGQEERSAWLSIEPAGF